MTKLLNETIGTMNYDGLIYDSKHPIDVFGVKLRAGQGDMTRGTVLALSTGTAGDSAMVILGTTAKVDETLMANCILADDASTGAEAGTAVVALAYRSGHFNRQALTVKVGYTLNLGDEEALRKGGIYLGSSI